MTDSSIKCRRCNSENHSPGRYCSICGSDLEFQKKLYSGKLKISIRWVLFSIISILIFEYTIATIAGQLFVLFSGATSIDLETSILVSSAGSLAGIYCGALYSAYMSPGFSIKEPMIGAAIEITMSQLILLVLSGTVTWLLLVRVAITMTLSFAGAKTGDVLQKRKFTQKK